MSRENEDAYAKRQRRKKAEGQGCALLLVAGLGGFVALALVAAEGISRLV